MATAILTLTLALAALALAEPAPALRLTPADAKAWRARLGAPVGAPLVRDATSVLAVTSRSPLPEGRTLARVREEGLGPEFARVAGGHSLAAEVEVDCAARAVRLRALTVRAEPGLKGAEVTQMGPLPGWRRPSGGLTMGKAVQAVCGAQTTLAEVAAAPMRSPAPPTKPPLPADTPRRGGVYAVQVGAGDSEAGARVLLAEVKRRFPAAAGLAAAVEPTSVDGKRFLRAILRGLPDRASAQALCEALKADRRACLVRWPPA